MRSLLLYLSVVVLYLSMFHSNAFHFPSTVHHPSAHPSHTVTSIARKRQPSTFLFANSDKSSRFLKNLEEERRKRLEKKLANSENATEVKPPIAYERAEEWDSRDGQVDVGFEERVRFDSIKEGDRLQQDENLGNAIKGDGK